MIPNTFNELYIYLGSRTTFILHTANNHSSKEPAGSASHFQFVPFLKEIIMGRKMQKFGEMAVLCPLAGEVGRSWMDPLQTPRGSLQPQNRKGQCRRSVGAAGDCL